MVVFFLVLELFREGRDRIWGIPSLALLPLMMIPWTNLHGGFFVGILMTGAYAAGELSRIALSNSREEGLGAVRAARPYILATFGCLAATFVNPYFYRLHVHVLRYLNDPFQSQYISEFQSLSFHHPMALFFEMFFLLGACAAFWYISKRSFLEPLLIVIWAHGALQAARNMALFAIAAGPPIAWALHPVLSPSAKRSASASRSSGSRYSPTRWTRIGSFRGRRRAAASRLCDELRARMAPMRALVRQRASV
jgi:hypothetical protein